MGKTWNCVLIDDEPLALSLLSSYIDKTEGLHLAATFTNPIEGLLYIQSEAPDLILLDVQMPELTGIQVMKILNQKHPIILTTAYQEYALEGFEHDVVDYLLKPISYERFLIAVQRLRSRTPDAPSGPTEPASPAPDFIFVKAEYKVQKVNLSEIKYLEGLGDYVALHTTQSKILTLENMKHFAQTLPERDFMRVHKSYLISFAHIDYIERNRIVIGDQRIPISETYKKAFWERVKG